jgi:hypothetical protein
MTPKNSRKIVGKEQILKLTEIVISTYYHRKKVFTMGKVRDVDLDV